MAPKPGSSIWVAPSASARIGGETLPPMILNAIGTRYFIDARLDGSIQDGSIESTTKGAPTLTLSVLDPDSELLNSTLFNRRIDLVLDNVPFRLVQVSRQEEDLLSLEFEHRLCSWLREHETPRKASRGTKTRAEFAYSLVLEVKKERVVFVSPDAHKRQARAAEEVKSSTRKGRDGRKAPGFSDNATNLRIGGAPATRSQLKEADKALSVAAALNASPLATKAMMVAGIGESKFKAIMNLGGSPYGGVFQGKAKERGGPWDIHDTEGMAQSFLKGGKGFQGGGAMALAKRRPPLAAGAIAYMVEGDISNFGGNAAAATHFYQKWSSEAERLIDAWRGASSGGLSSSPAGQSQGSPKFEFTRGAIHKGDAKEDSWMALQRLADQVRWRCFIDGRNVLYFVSDDQLMRSRPLYLVDPETQGVRSVTFDMEVGRRTVVYKGRRQRKPSEATLRVRMGRWAAPPGSIVELADYGIADGRWIVDSMSRGIFDAEAEVHLRQPQKALPEPAPSRTSGDGSGGSRSRSSASSKAAGAGGAVGGTPRHVIDTVVLPICRKCGIPRSVAQNDAANAAHGATVSGSRSDHQGPPDYAWAADMSNSGGGNYDHSAPTKQMDRLARALAERFGITWHGAGLAESRAAGYRFQMLYRTDAGGGHWNHVHFGVRVDKTATGALPSVSEPATAGRAPSAPHASKPKCPDGWELQNGHCVRSSGGGRRQAGPGRPVGTAD